jgi:hypothetical protein
MLVTNQTAQDYWFGPLHLLSGVGQTLTVDDTSATSLYLTEDAVVDAINNLYLSGKITVSSAAAPFPRPTGVPQLLHGDGSPEGLVFAPQGSVYMRRDGTGANSLYTKTTGVTLNTGWENYTTTAVGPGTTYRKNTAKTVSNTTTETDLFNGEITVGAGVLGTTGIARIKAWGDLINNVVSPGGPRLKLKLGGTVLIDTGAPSSSGQYQQDGTRRAWTLEAMIANTGAANSQAISFAAFLDLWSNTSQRDTFVTGEGIYGNGGGFGRMLGYNSGAIDTTTARLLELTVTNYSASTNIDMTLKTALVEII